MVREVLKLRTDNGLGENNPSFKDIEITDYSFDSPRMGMPTLTATLILPTCLDDEWTGKEYVVLREEKYYVRDTPTSEKDNTDARYKHSLEFKSEREQLGEVYFYDVVPSWSATYDRPNTNSTEFKFFGTIREYADRLNCAFRYAGIGDSILNTKTTLTDTDTPTGDGYCVVVSNLGGGDLSISKEMTFSDQWIWDALVEGYNQYKIPFAFRGKKIVFNEYVEVIDHVFKYGYDNSLLSVKKNNANARIINRITFKGSSENIPHYYPNETEYGHVTLHSSPTNSVLNLSNDNIRSMTRLLSKVRADSVVTLKVVEQKVSSPATVSFMGAGGESNYVSAMVGSWYKISKAASSTAKTITVKYKVKFTVVKEGDVTISAIRGASWTAATATFPDNNNVETSNLISSRQFKLIDFKDESEANSYLNDVTRTEHAELLFSDLIAGGYVLTFEYNWPITRDYAFWMISGVSFNASDYNTTYYWADSAGNRIAGYNEIGLSLPPVSADMVGDSLYWTASGRMPFQTSLMPPKYRETLGAERFYNALNDTYPNGNNSYLFFKNPYIAGNPKEYVFTDETIKPTIEGVKNASNQLLGAIAGIAFDANDNDSLKAQNGDGNEKNDAANYAHSFFYIKLNAFDGEYGFDLFNAASQTDPMTIQMTSGKCNGCKFKIQVIDDEKLDERLWRNPVQIDANGNIVAGDYDKKVNKNSPQEAQQDTRNASVWICVQKDAETFGVIMPNRSHDYMPAVGDTFNIINIDLPQGYILAAEKRGEEAMLRFMADNNDEKFNFDISASRIFFAENKELLDSLDENFRIKIEYNGHLYEQYVSNFGIECKNEEALPNVKLILVNELATGESFIQEIVNSAASLAEGGISRGGGGGLSTELADRRYLRKDRDDQSDYSIKSLTKFELGDFVSGTSGGVFFIDQETGESVMELDRIKVRMKAIFEQLEIAHTDNVKGKLVITKGGGLNIMFVEELTDVYRCYFKQAEEEKGITCALQEGDEVICKEFNVTDGLSSNATNKFYWRLVTAVNSTDGYVDLSKTDCAADSDIPSAGDTIVHYGAHDDTSRMSAIVFSTVDSFEPSITLHSGITHYNDDGTAVIQMGVDKSKNPPRPFFHCYGETFVGPKDGSTYVKFTPEGGVEIKGKLSVQSTVGDKNIGDYVGDAAKDAADKAKAELEKLLKEIQDQVDGVIESFNGFGAPTLSNFPANEWTTDEDRKKHNRDIYTDITPYVDDVTTPTAGQSWKWYYNSPTDYGWTKIADSDAVRALQLAHMSIRETDVLYISHTSQTVAPTLPTVNTNGVITDYKGWQTTAPAWSATKYIWQTTYVRKGDGTAYFSDPTCISGRNGTDGTSITITSTEVRYSTVHNSSTQPADSTFTLTAVPALTAGQYLWSRTKVVYSNADSTVSYGVSRIGTDGADGTSVTVTSTSVRYAKTTSATQPADSAFTYTTIGATGVGAGDYLWTKTEVTYSDNNKTKTYSVSRIGSDGSDGNPGTPGIDGKTPYVHYAYANSANGVTGFSTTYFKDALYVGVCTDYTATDPTDPTKYEWSRLRGEDGRGIVSVKEMYAVNNSSTNAPADSAFVESPIPQTSTTNRYLWNMEVTTYTDNTSDTSAKIVIGVHGANGADGASVTAVTNYYLASASATGVTTSTAGWTTDASASAATMSDAKPYLWNYEKVTYSKGTPTETVPHVVGRLGRGVSKIEEEYYLSDSQTQLTGGSWKSEANKPTWVAGKFMWTRTKITYSDGTVEYTGVVCVTGTPGTSVLAQYSADASSWHPTFTTGDIWMRTSDDGGNTWSPAIRIVGEKGAPGIPGADGQYRKFQWAKNNSATTAPTSGWQDNPMTAVAGEYVWMRSGIVVPPATNPSSWSTATRVTGDKGENGADVYRLDLDNEMGAVACNSAGTVTGTYPTSNASVYKGAIKLTSGVTYSIAQKTGISTASISSAGAITMSGLTADTATITVQAVVGTVTLTSVMTVYKVKAGANGTSVTVSSTSITYQASTSGTTTPTGSWSTSVPSVSAGQFLWTKTVVNYSDGKSTTAYSVSHQGTNGANGTSVTITSTSVTYYKGTSATQPADNQFTLTSIGTLTKGQYLWTKTVVTYSNGTSTKSYSAAYIGSDGAQGLPGSNGTDGKTTYVHFAYGSSITGSLPHPTAVGGFSVTSFAGAKYIGVCTDYNSADPTTHTSYEWSEYKGEKGDAAVIYEVIPSVDKVTRSLKGVLSASSVTCSVYKVTGNSARALSNDHTLTYTRYPDGATGTLTRTNGVSSAVTITAATEAVVFELKDGSTLLDRERVAVFADATDLEVGGRNLLRNSNVFVQNGNYNIHNYAITTPPEVGDDCVITIWGELAATKTAFMLFNTGGYVYFGDAIKIDDGIYQLKFTWINENLNHSVTPTHVYIYTLYESQSGTSTINRIKLEKGTVGTDWTPAPEDIEDRVDSFDYLKDALKANTVINGGLVLSQLIKLGQWSGTGDNATMTKVWSGHNGKYVTGRTIASWWGGDMVDRYNDSDSPISPVPTNAAAALVRMDGSAYFSQGNVGFRKDGSGWLGNYSTGIRFDSQGTMVFGSGIKIELGDGAQGLTNVMNVLVNMIAGINTTLVPVNAAGQELTWGDANTFAVKCKKGFYSLEFLSAYGQNTGNLGGGGTGGGSSYNRLDAWSDYSTDKEGYVLSAKLGYDLHTRLTTATTDISSLASRLSQIEGGGTTSVTVTGSGNAITDISKGGTAIIATKGATFLTQHQPLDHINSLDTRNSATTPSTYGASLRVNFKNNATNGLSDGGIYNGELYVKPYGGTTDHSGGYPHQLGFTANGNIWHRVGTSATAWGPWHKILTSANYASVLGSVYQAKGDYVTVAGTQTITGAKTFNSSINLNSSEYVGLKMNGSMALRVGASAADSMVLSAMGGSIFLRPNGSSVDAGQVIIGNGGGVTATSFIRNGGTSSQFLKADGSVDSNSYALASALNNYYTKTESDGRYLVYKGWKTNPGYDISVKGNYIGYCYGQSTPNGGGPIVSFSAANYGFQFLTSGVNGTPDLYFRSHGYNEGHGSWQKILTDFNYSATLDSRYVNKAGDTMTGALSLPRVNIVGTAASSAYLTADSKTNAFVSVNGKNLMVWDGTSTSVRSGGSMAGQVSLGTSATRWLNVYATTINVTSTGLVSNLNADMLDGLHVGNGINRVARFTNFPAYADFGYEGTADETYFSYLLKKLATDNSGEIMAVGRAHPNSQGVFIMHGYSGRKNGYPQYGSGLYVGIDGRVVPIRVQDGIYTYGHGIFDGNAASASRLQTTGTYTAWGQTYFANGVPQSVSGNMSGVGKIGFSNDREIGFNSSRFCFGTNNQGAAVGVNVGSLLVSDLWNDYTKVPVNGAYVKGQLWCGSLRIGDAIFTYDEVHNGIKLDKGLYSEGYLSALGLSELTNTKFTISAGYESDALTILNGGIYRSEYWGDEWNKGHGALNVAIHGSSASQQTPLLLAVKADTPKTGWDAPGARLFAMELLDNGEQMKFQMSGSTIATLHKTNGLMATTLSVQTIKLNGGGTLTYDRATGDLRINGKKILVATT